MTNAQFRDVIVDREERFTVGVEETSGRFYVSIPVSNGLVEYEEYYEIDADAFAHYSKAPKAALDFVERCRKHEEDRRLIYQPGTKRGSAT